MRGAYLCQLRSTQLLVFEDWERILNRRNCKERNKTKESVFAHSEKLTLPSWTNREIINHIILKSTSSKFTVIMTAHLSNPQTFRPRLFKIDSSHNQWFISVNTSSEDLNRLRNSDYVVNKNYCFLRHFVT